MSLICNLVRQRRTCCRCSLACTLLLGALSLSSGSAVAAPQVHVLDPLPVARSSPGRDDFIAEAALRFGIPPTWIRAVMRIESGGDPRAVSRAGARGLLQIMPATWAILSERYELGDDPFDERANILAGAAYLREMFDRYGDFATALAAYNAGPARVDKHLRSGQLLPRETRDYVARLTGTVPHSLKLASGAPRPSRLALGEPIDWRQANLFVARAENRGSLGGEGQAAGGALRRSAVPALTSDPPVRTDSAHQQGGLFIAASGTFRP